MARVIRIVLTFLQKPSRIPLMGKAKLSTAEKDAGLRKRCIEGATSDSVRLLEFKKAPARKRQP